MDLRLLFVFIIGFIGVYNVDAKSTSLSREKRESINPLEIIIQIQQLMQKCKKPNQPPADNNTSEIQNFLAAYDISCLLEGGVKIIQDIQHSVGSRRKRDTSQVIMNLFKLQQAVQQCQKSGVADDASILEKYDLGCVAKAVMDFIKQLSPPSNAQRRKRAIQFSDITCFIMKVMNEEAKIQEIVKAFSRRPKREASSEQICKDFGTTLEALLQFILDFAPGQA